MLEGSALRKLSAITGLEASRMECGMYRLDIAPDVSLFSSRKDEKAACEELRRANWTRVCTRRFEMQQWKCHGCSRILPLQGHHVIFRSRWVRQDGPLDVVENIEGCCAVCHEKKHGR